MRIVLLFILFISYLEVFSQNSAVVLKNKNDFFLIGKSTTYLEDAEGKMTVQDILNPANQAKFKSHDKDVFAQPGTPSAFWFQVSIQNQAEEDAWLEVATTYCWYIDFYEIDSLQKPIKHHRTGSMMSDTTKLYDVNTYWFPVNKAKDLSKRTYLIRVVESLAFEMPIQVGTIRSLSKNKDLNDFLTAGFIGLILIMFLYNSFLYASTKDHIYGYYLGYLLLMLISMTYATNYPFILNLDFGFINRVNLNKYFLLWHAPAYYCVGMFCIKYLNLSNEKGKLAKKIIQVIMFLMLVVFPVLLLVGIELVEIINGFQGLVLVLYLTCLITSYYFAIKKDKQARYYALGWTFMVGIVFIFFAVVNGFLPFNAFSRNTLYFGVAAEVWMFSLALGDRMNIIRKEKELAQAENLILIQEQNNSLETKVQERTKELYETNAEMQTLNEELNSILESLQESKMIIEAKNEHIMSSINYAKRIQNAMLPSLQAIKTYLEAFVIYMPKDVVSGDFYWFAEKEGKCLIAVGDCTGHGVPGALMSMLGTEILNKIVHNLEIHQPASILNLLNEGIASALKQQETGIQDGMDIIIVSIDKPNQQMIYAGAMNPLYYVQNGELTEIKADKKAIGGYVSTKIKGFTEHFIDISTPTEIYLCSDGYQDQFGGQHNKKYMTKNLKNLLTTISLLPTREQEKSLVTEFQTWKGNSHQIDDVVIIGIKIQ
jgi:two-component system, sensor histidine kinase LadS